MSEGRTITCGSCGFTVPETDEGKEEMAAHGETHTASDPQLRCQTIENGDDRCKDTATHVVHGLPGNLWSGVHCPRHTRAMVTSYDHQGGCVVRAIP